MLRSSRPSTGGYLLVAQGAVLSRKSLPTTASAGQRIAPGYDAATAPPGAMVLVSDERPGSYSGFRREYRKGEFLAGWADASTGGRSGPLRHRYEAPHTRTALIGPTRAGLSNLAIDSGRAGAARFTYGSGNRIDRVTVVCSAEHGIYLDRCTGVDVQNTEILNGGSGGSSDYGLAIGNSEGVTVTGCRLFGRRHGLSIGGGNFPDSIPSQNTRIQGCKLSNDPHSGVTAADMHGNSIDAHFRTCTITGGASLGGWSASFVDCDISSMTNGVCFYASEIAGGTFVIEDCRLTSSADPSKGYRGIIDLGGNSAPIAASTSGAVELQVIDTSISARRLSTASRIVEAQNRGSRFPIDLTVRNLDLSVNALGSVVSLKNRAGSGWTGRVAVDGVRSLPAGASRVASH